MAIVYLKQLICKIKESQLIFAHNPAYASFESRFESFENSRNMVYQFICALSEAGFYYSGKHYNMLKIVLTKIFILILFYFDLLIFKAMVFMMELHVSLAIHI